MKINHIEDANEIQRRHGMNYIEYDLRKMLAWAISGSKLYADDGELQDNSVWPFIDFLRDEPSVIACKLAMRQC